jgi:hypothetical protein
MLIKQKSGSAILPFKHTLSSNGPIAPINEGEGGVMAADDQSHDLTLEDGPLSEEGERLTSM